MTVSTEAWQKITRGCAEIISEKELRAKLEKGRPLRIKLGVDPTAPDLHLGHMVVLRKLKDFQELGHHIDFIIGDSTAQIGDPSGRSETRPPLTANQVWEHAETYKQQVFKILDKEKTQVHFNSSWLNPFGMNGIMELMRHNSVAQMLRRADFAARFEKDQDISLLEFVYPLLQGYDSVAVQSDLELGGTDQKFNLLMGREIQRDYKQELQVVMMMPLLEGLDGVKKMSKSYGNFVAFNDTPEDKFGKLMSVPDSLMAKYAELLTDLEVSTLQTMHPRDAKILLAKTLTAQFDGQEAAEKAAETFRRVVSMKEIPADVPEFQTFRSVHKLVDLIAASSMAPSKKEAHRLLSQGAVEVDGKRVMENVPVDLQGPVLIQVGKRRFIRIVPV